VAQPFHDPDQLFAKFEWAELPDKVIFEQVTGNHATVGHGGAPVYHSNDFADPMPALKYLT
jgi:hypothetical protein